MLNFHRRITEGTVHMLLYRQAAAEAEAEITIERSRFIAHVRPVESKEEADEFFTAVRKKYRDATHNVPAMVLGDKMQIQWGSDDGEPQGTSGAPMVQFMVNEGITNTAVIVTRYFGGIKLGTGGLVRAYTQAAQAGLAASGICQVKEMSIYTVKIDYSCLAKLQSSEEKFGYRIKEIQYEDMVKATLLAEPENLETVKSFVSNLTNGKAIIIAEEQGIESIPEK